jgi:2-hydroxychromene-2-carboxylate isomerase
MEQARWYFDLISPFSYLHYHRLEPLRKRVKIEPVPVLFAGLLKHWGTKGPAEVASKRLHTYQYCVWTANRMALDFRMPPRHPFNPLPSLRLLVALGAADEAVKSAFEFIYAQGRDPEYEFAALAAQLGEVAPGEKIANPEVKQQLAENTQEAISRGVFGVPTLFIRDKLFWGNDTVEWVSHFLDEPDMFEKPSYVSAARTEFGLARP